MRAVVSKRGVDDGNQKGGDSLQPAKENRFYYTRKKINCKEGNKKIFYFFNMNKNKELREKNKLFFNLRSFYLFLI